MLELRNVSAGYEKNTVLNGISLTFPAGAVTVVAGPNGCGKSTLLKAVAGMLPAQGKILLEGVSLDSLSSRQRAQKIAYLPQFLPASALTAEELIALGRNPYLGLSGKLQSKDREGIEEAIRLTETESLRHRLLATLSGGERQKIYLAMLLAQDAEILLLDEPTAHMDMGYTAEFLSLLRRLTEQGKTVLAVLHDLNDAFTFSHEVLLLNEGRLEDPSRTEEIFGVRKIPYAENGETKYFYK